MQPLPPWGMPRRRRTDHDRIPRDVRLGIQIAAAGLGIALVVCLLAAWDLSQDGGTIPAFFGIMADHLMMALAGIGYWYLKYNAREPPDGPPPSSIP